MTHCCTLCHLSDCGLCNDWLEYVNQFKNTESYEVKLVAILVKIEEHSAEKSFYIY